LVVNFWLVLGSVHLLLCLVRNHRWIFSFSSVAELTA
jgi:hypothetical protein